MRTSTITAVDKPAAIITRNYPNKVVSVYSKIQVKHQESNEFEVGQFKIKYKDLIPKEYALLTHS
mgnify:CR=1 FL=1